MKKYKKAYIEITNICNLSCSFCPKTKREKRYMTSDEFRKIAREVKKFTSFIYLHVMGEPLLHKELADILSIAEELGVKVNITSNGFLIDKAKDILLNSAALRKVSFSLHSFEANKTNVTIEKYLDDITAAGDTLASKGKVVVFKLWNIDSKYLKGENELNDYIVDYIEKKYELDYDLVTKLKEECNVNIKEHIYIQTAEKFEWPDIEKEEKEDKVFCYGLRDQFAILSDGTVVPCCLDSEAHIKLGNIFTESLTDILNSDKAKKIAEGFTRREAIEELCKKCPYASNKA